MLRFHVKRLARWLAYQGRRRTMRRSLPKHLDDLGLDDIVVDCGANVGLITIEFAKTGARVIAFEPDEIAYRELEERVGHLNNVECIKAAVSDSDGTTKLFHRPDRADNELISTQGSSLEGRKANVNKEDFEIVKTIDLAMYIRDLDSHVACIKMDIEGHEGTVLRHLLDSGVLDRIGTILVETHERKVPGLAAELDELKPKMSAIKNLRIDWDWI